MSSSSTQFTTKSMVAGDCRVNPLNIPSLELKDKHKEVVKLQTKGVAALFFAEALEHEKGWFSNSYRIKSPVSLKQKFRESTELSFGDNEKFVDEPESAFGTAFLIGKDLMLTAGHCVCQKNSKELDESYLKTIRVVFGYEMVNDKQCKTSFKESDVYQIKRVIAHEVTQTGKFESLTNYIDWALLKLDREVKDREPLEIDFSGVIRRGMPVYMIGHPLGLPSKFAWNGYIKLAEQPNIIGVELDSFGGNSGSPVFHEKTNKVIGILTAGFDESYYWTLDPNNLDEKGKPTVSLRHLTEEESVGNNLCNILQRVTSLGFVILYLQSKKGDCNACLKLSDYYFHGLCVQSSLQKSVKLLQKAAAPKFLWLGWIPYWYSRGDVAARNQLQTIADLQELHERALKQVEERAENQRVKDNYIVWASSDNLIAEAKYQLSNGIHDLMRFYKFWKARPSLNKEKALEEYVIEYQKEISFMRPIKHRIPNEQEILNLMADPQSSSNSNSCYLESLDRIAATFVWLDDYIRVAPPLEFDMLPDIFT